ncbi:MAG: leucine-rich repeat protein [Gordonibacter pamelaeae]
MRRSPAEELVSKGYFLPYAKRRCDGEELRCGEYRYRLREDGTARLVSYEGSAEQVDIPAEVDGARVASLATNLFRGHAELRRVSMPDTVEFAGNHVFDGCVYLRSVRLSAALDQVDPTMFLRCGALAEVELPMPLVRLEGNSFSDAPVAHVAFGPLVEALDAKPLGLPHLERVTVDPANEAFSTDGRALLSKDGRSPVPPGGTLPLLRGARRVHGRGRAGVRLAGRAAGGGAAGGRAPCGPHGVREDGAFRGEPARLGGGGGREGVLPLRAARAGAPARPVPGDRRRGVRVHRPCARGAAGGARAAGLPRVRPHAGAGAHRRGGLGRVAGQPAPRPGHRRRPVPP